MSGPGSNNVQYMSTRACICTHVYWDIVQHPPLTLDTMDAGQKAAAPAMGVRGPELWRKLGVVVGGEPWHPPAPRAPAAEGGRVAGGLGAGSVATSSVSSSCRALVSLRARVRVTLWRSAKTAAKKDYSIQNYFR
jgi:hypothetical protein